MTQSWILDLCLEWHAPGLMFFARNDTLLDWYFSARMTALSYFEDVVRFFRSSEETEETIASFQ